MPVARSVFGAPLSGGYPVITIAAIALCVLGYVAQMVGGGEVEIRLAFAPGVAAVEPYRLVTAAFLHGGIAHLALNMYALWVVGSFVEQLVGRWRFAALFLVSAVGGNMAVLAWARVVFPSGWYGLTLGASGAVFGLFAAVLVLSRRLGRDVGGIVTVIAMNLVLSFVLVHVSWQAHVGGLLTGAGLAAVYAHAPAGKRRAWAVAAVAGFGVVYVVAWWMLSGR
jgi:membrane associated rhomboid family serine protease